MDGGASSHRQLPGRPGNAHSPGSDPRRTRLHTVCWLWHLPAAAAICDGSSLFGTAQTLDDHRQAANVGQRFAGQARRPHARRNHDNRVAQGGLSITPPGALRHLHPTLTPLNHLRRRLRHACPLHLICYPTAGRAPMTTSLRAAIPGCNTPPPPRATRKLVADV